MKTLSVQQMPNGFEIETPSFAYWVKAGAAFFVGTVIGVACTFLLVVTILGALGLAGRLLNTPLPSLTQHSTPRR